MFLYLLKIYFYKFVKFVWYINNNNILYWYIHVDAQKVIPKNVI